MVEFDDHLEDITEEGEEFRTAIEEALEDQTGIEWEATDIYDRDHVSRVDVNVEPSGATSELVERFGDGVQFGGGLTIQFPK